MSNRLQNQRRIGAMPSPTNRHDEMTTMSSRHQMWSHTGAMPSPTDQHEEMTTMSIRRQMQRRTGAMPSPIEQHEEVRANIGMPVPPSHFPSANTNISSQLDHPLSNNIQQEEKHEPVADPSIGQEGNRRIRGPTWMHGGWGEDGGILDVTVNKFKQPIGKRRAARLASHLGVIARNRILAPLTYIDWRLMPSYIRDNIWKHIKENTNATDEMRHILMMSVSSGGNGRLMQSSKVIMHTKLPRSAWHMVQIGLKRVSGKHLSTIGLLLRQWPVVQRTKRVWHS